jgi:hypothetical protein
MIGIIEAIESQVVTTAGVAATCCMLKIAQACIGILHVDTRGF